jgi:hypothetical protein
VPDCKEELLTAAVLALMTDVVTRYGHVRLRAFGSSMIPVIRPSDILSVEQCSLEETCPGDVLLMRQGTRVHAHRLIRHQRQDGQVLLVTRGDALWHADPSQPASMLLGRVTGISRGGVTLASSRSITWLQRLYGLTLTEATRLWSPVRAWVASAAAAALRTTIGSPSHST